MHSKTLYRLAPVLAAAATLAMVPPTAVRADPFEPLNTPASTESHPGKLVWADLFTSNPDAATKFYSGLLGWTSATLDQKGKPYTIFSNAGHPVAGLAPHSPGKGDHPSRWIGYLSVADIDKTLAAATKDGAVVHAQARNFPKRGFQAIIGDVEGVPVGLLQSSSGDSPDAEPSPGDWNWFELYVKNPQAASNFYRDALGYDVSADTRATERKSDFLLASDGVNRGGIAPAPDGDDVHPSWLGVIRVANLDDTLAKVSGLGGEVLVAPHSAEYGSRFAIILDSTGGTVGLVQYVDDANPATSTKSP